MKCQIPSKITNLNTKEVEGFITKHLLALTIEKYQKQKILKKVDTINNLLDKLDIQITNLEPKIKK